MLRGEPSIHGDRWRGEQHESERELAFTQHGITKIHTSIMWWLANAHLPTPLSISVEPASLCVSSSSINAITSLCVSSSSHDASPPAFRDVNASPPASLDDVNASAPASRVDIIASQSSSRDEVATCLCRSGRFTFRRSRWRNRRLQGSVQ